MALGDVKSDLRGQLLALSANAHHTGEMYDHFSSLRVPVLKAKTSPPSAQQMEEYA